MNDKIKNKFHLSILSIALNSLNIILPSVAYSQTPTINVVQLPTVVVTNENNKVPPLFGFALTKKSLKTNQFANNDSATLLSNIPGMTVYSGGGLSSLPVINGLGDDRLNIKVDGMTITSACPNHMNPALSYINPVALNQINIYAGVVPVSQGGDAIGGSIAVKSDSPVFAQSNQALKTYGNINYFHRNNGNVNGISIQANAATKNFNIGYTGNAVDAYNYKDGNNETIVATRYKVGNHSLKLGTLSQSSLWDLGINWQDIPLQGYPNQSMDMTYNKSLSINAAYKGDYDWGILDARLFRHQVRHKMDVLSDKAIAAGFGIADSYMPMDTKALDTGYSIIAIKELNNKLNHNSNIKQTIRFGHEFHRYTLDDWWPPLAGSLAMGPDVFWNINGGKKDRLALFGELDTQFNNKLSTQIGARVERVTMNTGNVQGYYDMKALYGDAYESDATSFNTKNHKRHDLNLDLTASARYTHNSTNTYDIGFSRKTRSPNLHERYLWSNEAMMAGLMNNWFGDLNSYKGNINLRPEVAYTLKATGNWHDAQRNNFNLLVSPFFTYVKNYINAVPNTSNNIYNMSGLLNRQSLIFSNQDAQLYGIDISVNKFLGTYYGDWRLGTVLSYVRGKTIKGDNLYNIMPLNARLVINHSFGTWSNLLETVLVNNKNNHTLNKVRAEKSTSGYTVVNYQTTYQLNQSIKLEAGITNLFNRQYNYPLGGLEYITGNMNKEPQPLRAIGRSFNIGMSISF